MPAEQLTAPAGGEGGRNLMGGSRRVTSEQNPSRLPRPVYRLERDLSSTSLDSDALLDHRYALLALRMGKGGGLRWFGLFD